MYIKIKIAQRSRKWWVFYDIDFCNPVKWGRRRVKKLNKNQDRKEEPFRFLKAKEMTFKEILYYENIHKASLLNTDEFDLIVEWFEAALGEGFAKKKDFALLKKLHKAFSREVPKDILEEERNVSKL